MAGGRRRLSAIQGVARAAAAAWFVAASVMAAAPAGAQQAEEPTKQGGGSIFKRIWKGLGGGKEEAPPAAAEPAPPAPEPPSLAKAEWIGFTPVLVVGRSEGEGAWLAGPFPQAGAQGWVTDTVSGLTTAVRLVWRDAEPGSLAVLSAEAAEGLGLAPGAVAHVAIYLAR